MGTSVPVWKRLPWADSYRFFFLSEVSLVWKWCLLLNEFRKIYARRHPNLLLMLTVSTFTRARSTTVFSSCVLTFCYWFYITFMVMFSTPKTGAKLLCSYIQKPIELVMPALGYSNQSSNPKLRHHICPHFLLYGHECYLIMRPNEKRCSIILLSNFDFHLANNETGAKS